jgi:hypothetical protein
MHQSSHFAAGYYNNRRIDQDDTRRPKLAASVDTITAISAGRCWTHPSHC